MSTIVIYHGGGCSDGFTAAWVAKKAMPEALFFEGIHQNSPPDVDDMDVVILDFSYKINIIKEMLDKCKSLLILDHHISAAKELTGLIHPKLKMKFDITHSGAMLAWQYYFPNEKVPSMLPYIEDRDLWKNSLPNTKEVAAVLFSYPHSFELWDTIMYQDIDTCIYEGQTLLRKQSLDIKNLIKITKREMIIGGYLVPICNVPFIYSSEIGNILSKNKPFAGTYYDMADGRVFSLRSQPDGLDVSLIAEKYSGGGHKHASGFRMPINWNGDVDDECVA